MKFADVQTEVEHVIGGLDIESVKLGVGQFDAGFVELHFSNGETLTIQTDSMKSTFADGEEWAWLVKHGAWKRADDTR